MDNTLQSQSKFYNIKVGDIICRTTIPDRIVFNKNGTLYTIKLNNGSIEPLNLDGFDVIKGNVYE